MERVTEYFAQLLDVTRKNSWVRSEEDLLTWEEAFPGLGPGDILQGARDREGITQTELPEKIGVKPHHISEMESGKRSIGKDMARRLAKALNTGYKVFL
jgi:DNA-binding XRE family transcriptional regulator